MIDKHYSLGAIATPLRGGPFYSDMVSPVLIPDAVDPLRWAKQTCIWDQSQEGSCVGHGTAKALWVWNILHGILNFKPSRRDAYWQAELLEGTEGTDSGAEVLLRLATARISYSAIVPEVIGQVQVSRRSPTNQITQS